MVPDFCSFPNSFYEQIAFSKYEETCYMHDYIEHAQTTELTLTLIILGILHLIIVCYPNPNHDFLPASYLGLSMGENHF